MKVAYFDCFAGASGDMIMGALIDCGVPVSHLKTELEKLDLKGYKIEALKAEKKVLQARHLTFTSVPVPNMTGILRISGHFFPAAD